MKIYEQPICIVCKEPAIGMYGDNWICGRCLEKVINKEKEKKNKLLLEIIE